jgi:Cd2+/Zn2+-exporting ATPase
MSKFKEIPAHGIQATVQNQEIIAGNDKILHKFDVPHQFHFCDLSGTIIHVAIDRNYVGYLIISDEVKEDSHRAMKDLHKLGVEELVMLSGDDACIVEDLAVKLGIKQYHSNLLPEDKVRHVEKLQHHGQSVAFVGDGINDAPVIASADIGIAMGAFGSDAAIESADIVLMTDSLTNVGASIQIARKTLQIIWENIIAIFSVKVLFLILGTIGLMSMWGAVFADVGLTVLAVLNARRVLKYKPKIE